MRILTILFILIFLSSCRPHINKKNDIDCEVPIVECEQSSWTGSPLDTSYYNSGKNFYYSIKQVEGLNTSDQEYSIFLSDLIHPQSNKKINLATIGEELGQRTYLIERSLDIKTKTKRYDSFKKVLDIKGDSPGHIGFPTLVDNERIVIASTFASDQTSETKINGYYEIIPIEESIGQSRLYDVKKGNEKQIETDITHKYSHLIWESHPSFDMENNILFFASDRENGYGGVDLWYMLFEDEEWIGPYNCGMNVNTPCDDITPFPDPKGKRLYFSSAAHNSVGGYDLFYIDYKLEVTNSKKSVVFDSEIYNVGAPINTVADEISPFFKDNPDNYFYYSSDQDGDFDIFVKQKVFKKGTDKFNSENKEEIVENTEVVIPTDSVDINPMFKLEGVVTDKRTQEPIKDVDVSVTKEKETTPYKKTKTDNEGKYKFELEKGPEYNVKIEDDTLFYEQYTVKVDKNNKSNSVVRDISMDIVKTVRINFEYDKSDEPYDYILDSLGNQQNITWQNAIDNLSNDIKGSQSVIEEVIITGHTDPVASASYNKNLGQKRAEFVVSQLVKRGIPIYLLKAKSKGETQKLEKFENENTKQYHKRLRRVILEKVFIK
jgi:outer membrane protein OmpA-like peptidoglycan-associated protein